jgi:tetratricopeptide (TPR) repeat protein
MKAEHRKELQTNALADRIGRFIQGMKTRTQANSIMIWVVVLVVAALIGVWWLISRANKNSRSQMWVNLDTISTPSRDMPLDVNHNPYKKTVEDLEEIVEKYPGTKAALIARFDLARINLRNRGLDLLADNTKEALANLDKARREYTKLAEEYKDDPQWAARAKLGLAQIAETRAVEDLKNLDKAAKLYEEVANDYGDTAAGMEARERAKDFKDKTKREAIERFYKDLKDDPRFPTGR